MDNLVRLNVKAPVTFTLFQCQVCLIGINGTFNKHGTIPIGLNNLYFRIVDCLYLFQRIIFTFTYCNDEFFTNWQY